ncbi:4-alpha-glucanotransferase [Olsenella sp. HMSC062G07]|uniref:4-alpha-glucanotransferase n=1 Tax=Olsenella sp. HMSC062G07 TaxID=1739330 RepID=UPI0008A3BEEF|nr:4-alpha-glucanotransferase [Olsenella sp. HMSC062G07]OFK22287.1 4-alpha-glucanotransferase [Olsenella sp. HMSC062G07]
MRRSSGVLLPLSSLPSPYGIGSCGREAREFVDFLARAGQSWWQLLPVGPTSFGDSPYQSPSSFAGNPYFIDLDELVVRGVLKRREVEAVRWGADASSVDYAALYERRLPLLRTAFERSRGEDVREVDAFARANASWLADYALFMALKRHFGMVSWTQWPNEALRLRDEGELDRWRERLEDDVAFHCWLQWLFLAQWQALRAYAQVRGVGIIGDVPVYVALDSADVWASPEVFQLDKDKRPVAVAGVPPDYFNAEGQLWGNPLYDYKAMAQDGFAWWVRRMGGAARLFDVVRIDHFRGFESYWRVPAGAATARGGTWEKGPGMALVGRLIQAYPEVSFIAEDLGYPSRQVEQLLADSGLPGMKLLEMAFDARDESDYLPHRYERNSVCYVGTHDNAPIMGWRDEADPADVQKAVDYLGIGPNEGFNWGVIRGGMGSVADLFVAQMQDLLGLGSETRTNTPGTLGVNWRWRLRADQLTDELADRLATMTRMYGR